MKLLAITDRTLMGRDPLARVVELMQAMRERVIVQVREKDLSAKELYEWTAVLSIAAAQTGAGLMINGRVDVVRCFAPLVGVHLPEDGLSVREARALLPPGTRVGRSIHGAVHEDGADLYTIAPIFPTPSKPSALGLGVEGLREVVQGVRADLYALGGIDASNVDAVLATGVTGVAAIRAAWSGELSR